MTLLRSRISPVWALNVALVLGAAGLWWWHVRGLGAPAVGPELPWWLLLAAFAATERWVVHVHFRCHAHSLSLSDVPLLMGLLFADPGTLMLAWVGGAAAALAFDRGHEAVKLVFNLAHFAAVAAMAATLFHVLHPQTTTLGPAMWAATAVVMLASATFAVLLVSVAISLAEGRPASLRKLATMIGTALAVAVVNSCVGLLAAQIVATDARAVIFLVAPLAMVFVAYRAYLSERQRHEGLEFLYEASRALSRASETTPALTALLAKGLEAFRAEAAEVYLFDSPQGGPTRTALGPADALEIEQSLDEAVAAELRGLVESAPHGVHVDAARVPGALGEHLRARGVHAGMLAALPGETGLMGAVLLGNRVGVERAFRARDLQLFATLANHTGMTLSQDRLGNRVARLEESRQHLEHQAFHDPLTGLANRLLFSNRVEHALSRREGNVAVIYIDLDDFKGVNDTLGHAAGDALLVETARRLLGSLRAEDTPARLGGDEFAVLLTDIREEHTRIVADRILKALARPFAVGGEEREVPASLGVAIADSGSLLPAELLRNADAAMYASKHGGKRRFTVYDQTMQMGRSAAAPLPA
jgi:diguanylate cyclase (GGDEF)-like protein